MGTGGVDCKLVADGWGAKRSFAAGVPKRSLGTRVQPGCKADARVQRSLAILAPWRETLLRLAHPTIGGFRMSALALARPEDSGFHAGRLQRAYDLLEHWTKTDKVPAAALCVGRGGRMVEPRLFGRQRPKAADPIRKDALFLTASITKPVTVTAVMMLVERGLLALEDRVAEYVPQFAANGKQDVQ